MPKYSISALCPGCGRRHAMGIVAEILGTPPTEQTIAETFQGKSIPPRLKILINEKIQSPVTRSTFSQRRCEEL